MAFLFHVPTSCPNFQWVSIFDSNNWENYVAGGAGTSTWDGSKWVVTHTDDDKGGLQPDTWSSPALVDFRAAQIRVTVQAGTLDPDNMITFQLGAGTTTINLSKSGGGTIWTANPIDADDGDIQYVRGLFSGVQTGNWYITNIEFYYDLCDPNPGGVWGSGAPPE